jgi:DNA-directed RNA polymerase alpha subunit
MEVKMRKIDPDSDLIVHLPQNIGNPARSALAEVGITRLGQLTEVSEQELLKLHGVGPKAVRLLREALASRGLSFAQPDQPGATRRKD